MYSAHKPKESQSKHKLSHQRPIVRVSNITPIKSLLEEAAAKRRDKATPGALNECHSLKQLASENHDEAYSPPFSFFSAMDRLATPQFIIRRFRKSDFRCSEETTILSDLLGLVLGSSLIGQCRVPLGTFKTSCTRYHHVPRSRRYRIRSGIITTSALDLNWPQNLSSVSKNVLLMKLLVRLEVATRHRNTRDTS